MELTETQYARIEPCLPRQRGNVSMPNLQVLNAILYVAEQGCKWRGLPKRFGNWHTIYTRMNRWSKNGVLDRVFEHLQRAQSSGPVWRKSAPSCLLVGPRRRSLATGPFRGRLLGRRRFFFAIR